MDGSTLEGHPIPILLSEEQHVFTLNEEALEKVLLQDHIKDRNAVVVSVAGAFRKGKSFILDFFLRYMNHMYGNPHQQNQNGWLGDESAPLQGFSWRGGSDRDTTGILMWSEVFCTTLANGEKVAVILLDTQGTFDSESTVRDCATVFALSTMLSSIQIYNLSQNIQEDDLQHLQLFTDYGRLALEDIGKTPFQKLQFLVRDWSFPYEASYGEEGGQKILDKRLSISDKQHPELQSLRKHLKSCFSDIKCFLMPHPGLRVATNPNFDGRLSDIQDEFKECLQDLVPLLLSPEHLVQKEISGQKVKVKELVQYFKCYMNLFSGDDLPEPKSMLEATAEANNLAAVVAAKETYHQMMESVCGGPKPYLSSDALEQEHFKCRDKALEQFRLKRKMGGEEFSEAYRIRLEGDIDVDFSQFIAHNESKNIFKAGRTPAVIVALIIVFYIFAQIFNLFGLYLFAAIANMIMIIAFVSLATWAYIRYSGEIREVGEIIDQSASLVWEMIMKPVYQLCVQKSIQQVAKEATKQMMTRQDSQLNGRINS
ncbi:hypothetical protein V9T40_011146 [Parthenolecanium corni]|uniref:GB1/RHD3-type G domain-containing protein n=1 Tax=Parthenolecanium corni TaxID=536013 RepID=A0AAN9XZA0_9HEMI